MCERKQSVELSSVNRFQLIQFGTSFSVNTLNIVGHLRTNSSSHNTIGQCLLYNVSHTAVSLVLYAVDKRPTWPKRPAITVIDSATYLLRISSPDIDKVAMSLYDIKDKLVRVVVGCL